jgi:Vibrionales, replication initiator protein RctB, central region
MEQGVLFSEPTYIPESPCISMDEEVATRENHLLGMLGQGSMFISPPSLQKVRFDDRPEMHFYNIMREVCEQSPGNCCSLSMVTKAFEADGIELTKTIRYRYINKLEKTGYLEKIKMTAKGYRTVYLYLATRKNSAEETNSPVSRTNYTAVAQYKKHLVESGQVLKKVDAENIRSEGLMSGIFDRCIRLNSRDNRKDITSNLYINDQRIDIKTTCQNDKDIAHLSDVKVVWALYSIVLQQVEAAGECTSNQFMIDIAHLCDMMQLKPTGGNRDVVRDAVYRLWATNFAIKTEGKGWFNERFGVDVLKFNFSFVSELVEADDYKAFDPSNVGDNEARKTRYFIISLPNMLFEKIKTNDFDQFSIQPELMKEKVGLALSLYNLCKTKIGITNDLRGNRTQLFTMSQLRANILPGYKDIKRFSSEVRKVYQKHLAEDGVCRLYGYVMNITSIDGEEHITLFRDKSDNTIGNKSRRNKKLINA